MFHLFRGLALLPVLAVFAGLTFPVAAEEKGDTLRLFNGKNLDGWRIFLDPKKSAGVDPKTVFHVVDGIIQCKGQPSGYLITEKEYGDYVLTVEWRWPGKKGGNSGVFVHCQAPDKIWPRGVEAQLMSGRAGDFWLVGEPKLTVDKERQDQKTPRHFFRLKTDKEVEKPIGEWNRYEITCKGGTIELKVNGQLVNKGTDGELTKGRILLQSEGTPIEFRNVTLRPLSK